MASSKVGDAYVEIATRRTKLMRGLEDSKRDVGAFVRDARRQVGGGSGGGGIFGGIGTSLSAGLRFGAGAAAGVFGFEAIKHAIGGAIEAATEDENSQVKLRASLRATGNEVENNAERINAMADEMRDTVNVNDDAARGLASYGLNLGVTTDKINEMTKAAIGLSEATGDDMESSMVKLVKANQGGFTALEKQLPILKSLKTEEEKLAYVQKISKQGLEERAAQLRTLGGSMKQLKLSTGELAESLGGLATPMLSRFARAMTVAVNVARGMTDDLRGLHDVQDRAMIKDPSMWTGPWDTADGKRRLRAVIDARKVAGAQAGAVPGADRVNPWNSGLGAAAVARGRADATANHPLAQRPGESNQRYMERMMAMRGQINPSTGNSPTNVGVFDKIATALAGAFDRANPGMRATDWNEKKTQVAKDKITADAAEREAHMRQAMDFELKASGGSSGARAMIEASVRAIFGNWDKEVSAASTKADAAGKQRQVAINKTSGTGKTPVQVDGQDTMINLTKQIVTLLGKLKIGPAAFGA